MLADPLVVGGHAHNGYSDMGWTNPLRRAGARYQKELPVSGELRMRSRLGRMLTCGAIGYCLQIASCSSEEIAEILAQNISDTAAQITAFVVESRLDELFGLE
jgi:hypothetical protein